MAKELIIDPSSLSPKDQARLIGDPTIVGPLRSSCIKKGFSSAGFRVGHNCNEYFVKATPLSDADMQKKIAVFENMRTAAGKKYTCMPAVHGIFAVTTTGDLVDTALVTSTTIDTVRAVLTVCDLLDPEVYFPLVDLMRQMGMHTIQTEETADKSWFTTELMIDVYHQAVDQLVSIHQDRSELPENEDEKTREYREGITHVITSPERFDAIHAIGMTISPVTEIITPRHSAYIREQMIQLVEKYTAVASDRITPIHGDPWMANRLVREDGHSYLIDPAPMQFGDPAYDVTFALTDLAFVQMNRNGGMAFGGEFTDLAQQSLQEYMDKTGDTDVPRFMALFYAYKAFVSAVFDAGDNQVQRVWLLNSALGVVTAACTGDFQFSFAKLDEYAQEGQALYQSLIESDAQ